MAFVFNPFTGTLDVKGSGAGAAPTTTIDLVFVAAENISALKVVYADTMGTIRVASSDHPHRAVGVAITSGLTGQNVTVRTFGEFSDVSFLFATNDLIFFNNIGGVDNVAPSGGYLTQIGHALASGSIFINIKQSVQL
jgi:hypothetical protein